MGKHLKMMMMVLADVDECKKNNGDCTQSCVNTKGSFTCTCNPGFQLGVDQRSCYREWHEHFPIRNQVSCLFFLRCYCPLQTFNTSYSETRHFCVIQVMFKVWTEWNENWNFMAFLLCTVHWCSIRKHASSVFQWCLSSILCVTLAFCFSEASL